MNLDVIRVLEVMGVDADKVGSAFHAVLGSRDVALLKAAMRDDSNVLAGSTIAPPVVDRLIGALESFGALESVGARGPVPPKCFSCGTSDCLTTLISGPRSCEPCRYRARAKPCATCGSLVEGPKARSRARVRSRWPTPPWPTPSTSTLTVFSVTGASSSRQRMRSEVGSTHRDVDAKHGVAYPE